MVTKWIKYRLALICKTWGKHREVHNHWVRTTWRNNIIKCWLNRFCMIIQDSNISRLWHVKASENNQEILQTHVANWFAFNIGHSDSIFYHQSKPDGHYCCGCTCWRNTLYASSTQKSEIGVIISYALISLKTCIPNETANLLFWHTHLIPYSM